MKFEIVQSEYGPIKGVHKESALGTDYVSFQGVPYMKAPIGKLRFRDAQPMDKWSAPFDATGEATTYCASNFITGECEGQEDSSVLNVFTKNVKPAKQSPVMIWVIF
jgi:cholinesterase